MNEADEEHHVAKVLIAELEEMDGRKSHYDAKFTVLAENVRHHIKEEESEVFPKAKDANIDFEALAPVDDGAQGRATGQGRSTGGGGSDGCRQPRQRRLARPSGR
jgi:hypothetical protein